MYAVLDTLKVANTVMLVVSALTEQVIDEESEKILIAILAQGLPSSIVAGVDLENLPMKVNEFLKITYLFYSFIKKFY